MGGEGLTTPHALIQLGALEGLGINAVLDPLPLLATQLGILSPVGVYQVRYTLIFNADVRFNDLLRLSRSLTSSLQMVSQKADHLGELASQGV